MYSTIFTFRSSATFASKLHLKTPILNQDMGKFNQTSKLFFHHQTSTLSSFGKDNFSTSQYFLQTRQFAGGDLKAVSDRIKSVKSIQKITKAMKMIAAAKLKGDQSRLEEGYSFSLPPQKIIDKLKTDLNGKGDLTIIAFSSDRGLCGGINSAVAKQTSQLILNNEAAGNKVTIYGIGDKIRSALMRLFGNRFNRIVNEMSKLPWSFTTAGLLAERLAHDNPERIVVVFNKFINLMSYETLTKNILSYNQAIEMDQHELDFYEFEPERRELWQDFHEFYYACTLHGCMLDNLASEQSARLSAMDNATSNATDMISSLTLRYNRARQAKITSELIEIISGASAV